MSKVSPVNRFAPILAFCLASTLAYAQQAPAQPSQFQLAERFYQTTFNANQRILLQVLLTAGGYFPAVPNEDFNQRVFRAIQKFQAENGRASDGILDVAELGKLFDAATPLLARWRFEKVRHPFRSATIWVPFGLDLVANRNERGIEYKDKLDRIELSFNAISDVRIAPNFATVVQMLQERSATIHYKVLRDGWYAISATTPDGTDYYIRYHQDGTGVTGFTLRWKNANGNVAGERIATLVSASLWASMTGATFIDPPVPRSTPAPQTTSTPVTPAVPQPPIARPQAPEKRQSASSGTGFFVSREGHLLTNAHVVEDCSLIQVTPDRGQPLLARLVAADKVNDLALLKTELRPPKVAAIRVGIRLGEPIAVFGFPLAQVLASSGNFTLGNVTALAGLRDDTGQIQISAPVQPGNSGGPLLDGNGNLVGIVQSKLNALKVSQVSGDIPQNVNFAIKATTAVNFLETHRISVDIGSSSTAMPPADLAEHAKSISAFIGCRP